MDWLREVWMELNLAFTKAWGAGGGENKPRSPLQALWRKVNA
jgi:hypothetical protein